MKKQGAPDAKRAAANDKPENGKAEKAREGSQTSRRASTRSAELTLSRRILEGVLRFYPKERHR